MTGCVAVEHDIAGGGVEPLAGRGAEERVKSGGSVAGGGGVAVQRTITDSRVEGASCEAKESIFSLSSVAAGIASVRCRSNGSSRRKKRKTCERKY